MKKFNIKSLNEVNLNINAKLFKNNSVEFFYNSKNISNALAQAILEGDREAFHEIFSGYLNVINKEELARKSNVPIATIRRMAAGSNFNIDNMLKITSAINKELAA
jgi:hypothetical protein